MVSVVVAAFFLLVKCGLPIPKPRNKREVRLPITTREAIRRLWNEWVDRQLQISASNPHRVIWRSVCRVLDVFGVWQPAAALQFLMSYERRA